MRAAPAAAALPASRSVRNTRSGMISVLLSTAPLLTVQSAVRHVESKLLFSPFAKLILHVAAQRPRVSGDTSDQKP